MKRRYPVMSERMITLLAALLLVWTASQGLIQTQRLAPQLIASLHGVDHPLRGDSQNDDCLKLPDGIGGLHKAMALLPEGPHDNDTWGQWTTAVREATGRKGKALFMPLRKALTGQSNGPDMARVLPLLQVIRARREG